MLKLHYLNIMKPSKMASPSSKMLTKGSLQKHRLDPSESSDMVSFPHSNHKGSINMGGGNENDISISSIEGPPFLSINNNQRK